VKQIREFGVKESVNSALNDIDLLPLALARSNVEELERRVEDIADKFGILSDQNANGGCLRDHIRPHLSLADEPTGSAGF
jgi:hypothetical protein